MEASGNAAAVRRYPFSVFSRFAALSDGYKRRQIVPKIKLPAQRPISGKKDAGLFADLINDCLGSPEGNRSEVDFRLCCEAVERGWLKESVWDECSNVGKFAERGREYFERTWAKAENHTRLKIYEEKAAKRSGKADKPSAAAPPGQPSIHDAALQAIQLEVLGRCGNGHIKVFSKSSRSVETIRNVDQYGYGMLAGLAGPAFISHVLRYLDSDAPVNGHFDLKTVQEAIALGSHGKEIMEGEERGPGCWACVGDSGPSIAIVGDKNACEWNGSTLIERNHPRFHNLMLDFEGQNYQQWYDFAELELEIRKCSDVEYRREIFHELLGLLSRWNWNHESMPMTACGVIFANWIQTLWQWRPQILVGGESNSGKSTMFRMLSGLYGRLALTSSQSSAAGLRQALETTARIPLCDEFDAHDKAQRAEQSKILKMVRDSGRGNETLRGTAAQKSRHFTLRHIFWMAGTNVEFTDTTDKNRFIIFELEQAREGKENQLRIPTQVELQKLGIRSFAAVISVSFRALELADYLLRTTKKHDYAHSRQVESYSVPAAMIAAICGDTEGEAEKALHEMMAPVAEHEELQIRHDHETLLEDLLTAYIPPRESGKKMVSQWLHDALNNNSTEAAAMLEKHNMKLSYMTAAESKQIAGSSEGNRCLMIHPTQIRRNVLVGTQWESSGFKHAIKGLKRFSAESRRRIGSYNARTIVIDWRAIERHLAADDGEQQSIDTVDSW